ncbi:hypothetical protein SAMN05216464_110235 [Mucilaginibacter pineti]|uniref:Uncharacterized protein n=1 Tax=Mucilaginibacter pineti TaxID=1391627 RepID=A0A1G7GPA3_9SPHI|nr:hypothetical protein [Mucilaginibacter pineti]SDE89952.1 hypothetical protein SAMN05216464_110235 [Mucilaginibacter pineti]
MSNKFIHAAIYQLSVGNVLQNILFYGMLVFMTWVISYQLNRKKTSARKKSIAT